MKRLILVIMMLLLTIGMVNATDYYVNCTEGNSSSPGTDSANPWDNVTSFDNEYFAGGDNIYIKGNCNIDTNIIDIYFNSSTTGTVTFQSYGGGANLTQYVYEYAQEDNGLWRNKSGYGGAGLCMWNTTISGLATDNVMVYFPNGTEFINSECFNSSVDDSCDSTNPDYFTAYGNSFNRVWVNQTSDEVRIIMKDCSNPNNQSLYIVTQAQNWLLKDNVNNIKVIIKDLDFRFHKIGVELRNMTNITFEHNNFHEGLKSIYMNTMPASTIRGNITIRNNTFIGNHPGLFYSLFIKGDYEESDPISFDPTDDWYMPFYIHNNSFIGTQGAISMTNGEPTSMCGSQIYDNLINNTNYGGASSAIEIENYCCNSSYYNNKVIGGHMSGVSFGAANASAGKCEFHHNTIALHHWENETTGTSYETYAVKAYTAASTAGIDVVNWNISQNTFVGGGRAWYSGLNLPTDKEMFNNNITNNIFYSSSSSSAPTIRKTGEPGDGNYWNYNLYFKNGSTYLFSYYSDNDASSSDINLATAKSSAYWDGIWDINSEESDPSFIDINKFDLTPTSGSPACTMSSTGSYVGALPCGSTADTTPPGSVTLIANTTGTDWIYLQWTVPTDSDFNWTSLWLNETFIANTTEAEYNFTSLTSDTNYTFVLTSVDEAGNEGTNTTHSVRTLAEETSSSCTYITWQTYQETMDEYDSSDPDIIYDENLNDGNWATYGRSGGGSFDYFEWYDVPLGATTDTEIAIKLYAYTWNISLTGNGGAIQPGGKLAIRVHFDESGSSDRIYVYVNTSTGAGTTWSTIYVSSSGVTSYIYEIGVVWHYTNDYFVTFTEAFSTDETTITDELTITGTTSSTTGSLPMCVPIISGFNNFTIGGTGYYNTTYYDYYSSNDTGIITGLSNSWIKMVRNTSGAELTANCYLDADYTEELEITNKYAYLADNATGTTYNYTIYCPAGTDNNYAGTNFTVFKTTNTVLNTTLYFADFNSVYITFKEQSDGTIINTTTVYLEIISDVYSNNYSTTNGTVTSGVIIPSTYTARYWCENHTTRFYMFTVTYNEEQNLTLYLIKDTEYNNITTTVIDQNANPVADATVKALKYDLDSNSYILQEMSISDNQGEVIQSLTMYDEYYKFMVEYEGVLKTTTTPAYITSNSLVVQISLGESITTDYDNYMSLYTHLEFNNNSNNFRLDYSDTNSIISQVCVEVYTRNARTQTLISRTCSSSASATILSPVTPTTGATYTAEAYYVTGSSSLFLDSLTHTYTNPEVEVVGPTYGLFLQLLLTCVMAFIAVWSIPMASIAVPLSLIIGKMLNLNFFGWDAITALTVAGIIIAYLTRKDNG